MCLYYQWFSCIRAFVDIHCLGYERFHCMSLHLMMTISSPTYSNKKLPISSFKALWQNKLVQYYQKKILVTLLEERGWEDPKGEEIDWILSAAKNAQHWSINIFSSANCKKGEKVLLALQCCQLKPNVASWRISSWGASPQVLPIC